jgi:hypothetical protein
MPKFKRKLRNARSRLSAASPDKPTVSSINRTNRERKWDLVNEQDIHTNLQEDRNLSIFPPGQGLDCHTASDLTLSE